MTASDRSHQHPFAQRANGNRIKTDRINLKSITSGRLLQGKRSATANKLYLHYPIPQSGGYANATKEININITANRARIDRVIVKWGKYSKASDKIKLIQ